MKLHELLLKLLTSSLRSTSSPTVNTPAPVSVPAELPANIQILTKALEEYGTLEVVGNSHNPTILNYAQELKLLWVVDDETPWCGIFAGAICQRAGLPIPKAPALAANWKEVGVETQAPEPGDIAVFTRDGGSGHVAFFIRELNGKVYVLGGNQSNQVNIQAYDKARLVCFRTYRKV